MSASPRAYTDYKLYMARKEAEEARLRLQQIEAEAADANELPDTRPTTRRVARKNRIAQFDIDRRQRLVRGMNAVQIGQQVRRHARAWCEHLGIDYELMMGTRRPAGYPNGWRKASFTKVQNALIEQGYTSADIKYAFGI